MIKLTFPKEQVTTRQRQGVNEVFDVVRKKWIQLSPEEWVRQNMVHLLLSKKYPATLISVEKGTRQGELLRRCEIVVYTRDVKPFMSIECKEMNVPLSEKVLGQILRYHITLPAQYLIVTNGTFCFGFEKNTGQFVEINFFPEYQE